MLRDVQGQSEGVQHLQRIVEGKLTTPLLLVGPSGVGRRYSVVEAAKEAFQNEAQCTQVDLGTHPDLVLVKPEAGKVIKVAAIRDLVTKAGIKPMRAHLKFLVVDGVDRMTDAASNALLKTLEEAPASVRFFLLAEDIKRVIPTIRSRCVDVFYKRLPEEFILAKLAEQTDDATKALVCCRLAEGSLGRAVKFYGSGRLMLRDRMLGLLKIGLERDLSLLFPAIDSVSSDLDQGLVFLDHLLHDLIMFPHDPSRLSNLDVTGDLRVLRERLGGPRIAKLRSGLQQVQQRHSKGSINLAFHVKAMMASSFN